MHVLDISAVRLRCEGSSLPATVISRSPDRLEVEYRPQAPPRQIASLLLENPSSHVTLHNDVLGTGPSVGHDMEPWGIGPGMVVAKHVTTGVVNI